MPDLGIDPRARVAAVKKKAFSTRLNHLIGLFTLFGLISACISPAVDVSPINTSTNNIAQAAAAQRVAEQYLQAWQAEDFTAMYRLTTTLSRDAISLDEFQASYNQFTRTLTLEKIDFQLLSALSGERVVEVAYRIVYSTRLLGELSREMVMSLAQEGNAWLIQWESALMFPELREGNRLEFIHRIPPRGRIVDRNSAPLAAYEDAIAVGLVPGEILPDQAEQVYETISEISFYTPDSLARVVASTPADWYLPVITLSQAAAAPYIETLRNLRGVRLDELRSRFYAEGGVAPHAVGYMQFISEENLDAYLRLGYRQDERVGTAGLEGAFETALAGQRGGSLYLLKPDGDILSILAASDPVPGQSMTTTLDKNLQMLIQSSLGDQRGAVVVMEVDTGRVLALVSNPHFNSNAFDLSETDRSLLESYFNDPDQPLFNRATQGQYPLGSVFKAISMSAAMEAGLYHTGSILNCPQAVWVCNSVTLYDWTFSHGVGASGPLTLQEGLMRSCNPWYYRIGEDLYDSGLETALTEMAAGFGLGQASGIGIAEASGNIPASAGTCVNHAQIAIGQGEVLVTPLQVAAFFAALANGGTLYQPTLVETIRQGSGEIVYSFSPTVKGNLPISDETLAAVQEAIRMVVEEPRGTGYWPMLGLEFPVSGKTGTAETPTGLPHAWFAGYTRLGDSERADIAIAVLVENSGEGSAMAAPLFHRVVSLYFSDNEDAGTLMIWEEEPYVPKEPTPMPERTPDSPSDE